MQTAAFQQSGQQPGRGQRSLGLQGSFSSMLHPDRNDVTLPARADALLWIHGTSFGLLTVNSQQLRSLRILEQLHTVNKATAVLSMPACEASNLESRTKAPHRYF
jgi:hypothetical protein